MAGEWPEGFRLNPAARFDDEMQRLGEAANADVVVRLTEGNKAVRACITGCTEPAVRIITVSSPDKKTVASFDMCEAHGQAASNDRANAKLGVNVEREFSDEKLGGDRETVLRIEPVVTSPDLNWTSVKLVDREREPIGEDTLRRAPGDEL